MAKKEVPGLMELPTAAAALKQSQFYANELDKKFDADIKKQIMEAIAAGRTMTTVTCYMPEITKKELKKLNYKVKERSWDGFDYYVVSWE